MTRDRSVIYLDNAATSFPKPPEVGDAMKRFVETAAGNPGRGGHRISHLARHAVETARRRVARLIGAADERRVVFALNATDALHLAFCGMLQPGDRVLVSSIEHNSVMRPLRFWQARGVLVDVVPCPNGKIDPGAFHDRVKSGARLVVCAHASNVTGIISPIEELAVIAHECGACLLVDAAQTVGHFPIDVTALGADLLAFSGHKGLMGPTGTGALYVSQSAPIQCIRPGGTGTDSDLEIQPEDFPQHLESGTPNTVGIAGLDASLKFIEDTGIAAVVEKQNALMERIVEGVSALDGIHMVGNLEAKRVPVLSMTFDGIDAHQAAAYLDARHRIAVRSGLHCAPAAHKSLGTYSHGTLRVSPGFFNTPEDVDTLLLGLKEALRLLIRRG